MKSNKEEFIDNGEHLAITRIELPDEKVILGVNCHSLKIKK